MRGNPIPRTDVNKWIVVVVVVVVVVPENNEVRYKPQASGATDVVTLF